MTKAFVFPGQGSQAVGMGKALFDAFPTAKAVFDEVDDALSQKLSALMFEGPEKTLTLTENAQPALMAVSIATLKVLEHEGGFALADKAVFVAGHSLGEYSALCAAGTFSIGNAARLLKTRGLAMQAAVPVGEGAMAALLGLEASTARKVAAEAAQGEVCEAANDNAPGQVVVSGTKAAVQRAVEIAMGKGARRAVLLPVSAPFHCALMRPAADAMAEALPDVAMNNPVVPLIANVTADVATEADIIRDLLIRQTTGPVRWRESVLAMKAGGVESLLEIGAGRVLSGLVRRIDRDMTGASCGDPESVLAVLADL